MSTMSGVSSDFKRYVHYLESDQQVFVKLNFSSDDELIRSTEFFFDKAIKSKGSTFKYADSAKKLHFIGKEESELNLRKTCIAEIQKRLESLVRALDNGSSVDLAEALALTEFFGNFFNVGFIFKGIVKKYLDIFYLKINDCAVSWKCFFMLLEVSKERALKISEEDQTVCMKGLLEILEKSYDHIPCPPEGAKKPIQPLQDDSKTFEEKFPNLMTDVIKSKQSFAIQKLDDFKMTLSELNSKNVQQILKNLEECTKHQFRDGQWQLYYNELIEKALQQPNTAEGVLEICQKLPRSHAWQGFKAEDCKKYINDLTVRNIEKILELEEFDEDDIRTMNSVINFIQELLKTSLCSIGNVAKYFETMTSFESQNIHMRSQFVMKLIWAIKSKVTSNKIKKLPHELRQKILQIIAMSYENSKLMSADQVAQYLGVKPEPAYHSERSTPNSIENDEASERSSASSADTASGTSESIQPSFSPNFENDSSKLIVKEAQSYIKNYGFDNSAQMILSLDYVKVENLLLAAELLIEMSLIEIENGNAASNLASILCRDRSRFFVAMPFFMIQLITGTHKRLVKFLKNEEEADKLHLYRLTNFLSRLYLVDVISDEYFQRCAEVLLTAERTSPFASVCVQLLMAITGHKLEKAQSQMLERYFKFFKAIATSNEKSNRSMFYKTLITLRECNWDQLVSSEIQAMGWRFMTQPSHNNGPQMEGFFNQNCSPPPTPVASIPTSSTTAQEPNMSFVDPEETDENDEVESLEDAGFTEPIQDNVVQQNSSASLQPKLLVFDFRKLKDQNELNEIVSNLKTILKSVRDMKSIINILFNHPLGDFREISVLGKLFKELGGIQSEDSTSTFKDILIETISAEFDATNGIRKLKDAEKENFTYKVIKVGEFYRNGILSDEDLATWLLHKHINKLPLSQLTYLSSIVGPQINDRGNRQIKLILGKIEELIEETSSDLIVEISEDLKDLFKTINSMKSPMTG